MSFLSVLKTCHNDQLPDLTSSTIDRHPSFPAQAPIHTSHQQDEPVVPFYIHLPDQLPGLTVIKPSPLASPTMKAKTRRTSSSTHSRLNIQSKPLSSYLSTFNSPFDESDDRSSNPFDHHPPQSTVYDHNDRTRDSSQPIGFLRAPVLKALIDDNQHMIQSHSKPCWKLFYPTHLINLNEPIDPQDQQPPTSSDQTTLPPLHPDQAHRNHHPSGLLPSRVSFEDWINESESRFETRLEHIDRLVRGWKEVGLFSDQLSGWRNEEYSVYGPKDETPDDDQARLPGSFVAFKIERAAVGLFGFLSFGAHLTAYLKNDDQYFFWIPRRSSTKPTWPSKLDNTVAGGIPSGESAYETIIRECFEEASFEEQFVRSRIKSTGLISYTHRNDHGWIQPEIQYTYDLELPSDNSITPRPNDGEAENFKLMGLDEVMNALKANEFKPNCAGVLIDFFVRHGILNEFNEPNYCLVSTLLKQLPVLPLP